MPINWDVQFAPDKQKYTGVVLAYVDILGFSNAVGKSRGRFPKRLANMILELYEVLNSSRSEYLETRFISDSFLIWGESSAITLALVSQICSRLETTALQNGFLVRGIIVGGAHYSGRFQVLNLKQMTKRESYDEITISPALIAAVKGEKDMSRPGIYVHKSCHKHLKRMRSVKQRKQIPNIAPFSNTSLDLVAADFFNSPSLLSREHIADARSDMKRFHRVISGGLRTNNQDIFKKWQHVAKSFDRVFALLGPRIQLSLPPIGRTKRRAR